MAWQNLPQSFHLAEPLPVNSILHVFEGNLEVEKLSQSFDTPQAAIAQALGPSGRLLLSEVGEHDARGDLILAKPSQDKTSAVSWDEHFASQAFRVVLMETGPGQGKTSALLWTAHLASQAWADGLGEVPGALVPWYQDLSRLPVTGNAQDTLEGILDNRPKVMRGKPALLFLDGLDLLTKGTPEPDTLVLAALRSAEDEGHRFVISSRPVSSVHGALPGHGYSFRIELAGLDEASVDKWLDERLKLRSAIDQICQANYAARDLLYTPLLFAMVVSAAKANLGGKEPLKCDRHPGRAGLFAEFIDHLVERAKLQKRLDENYVYSGRVLEGLCWATLTAGHMEEVPGQEFDQLLGRALAVPDENEPPMPRDQAESQVLASVEGLREAGIILKAGSDRTIRFIHQEFMEHLGGRHLARRLEVARQRGWLDAELWDHLGYRRLDNLLVHGLAQLSEGPRQSGMSRAFKLLSSHGLKERVAILANADWNTTVQLIKPFLERGDENAVRALRHVPTSLSEPLLINMLKDRNNRTNRIIVSTLGTLGGTQAVVTLIERLKSRNEVVRRLAARALGEIRSPQAVQPLIKALKSENGLTRAYAAQALGYIHDPEALRPLIEALRDEDDTVRRAAAFALGDFKSTEAVKLLMNELRDANGVIRRAEMEALCALGAPNVAVLLEEAVQIQDLPVRLSAIRWLGRLKPPRTVDTLINVLQNDKDRGGARDGSLCSG